MAAAVMAALSFAACSSDDNDGANGTTDSQLPAFPLTGNALQYGDKGRAVALQSAVYTVSDDGSYTFYFHNTAGYTLASEMEAEYAVHPEDMLILRGVRPGAATKAEADGGLTSYTVQFGGRSVTASPQYKEQHVWLTHDAGENGERVYLKVQFQSAVGKDGVDNNFYALYDGPCAESGYPVVRNGYAIGKDEPTAVTYVVETRNVMSGEYGYAVYESKESEKAVVEFSIPADALGKNYSVDDLFTAEMMFAGIEIKGGGNTYGGISVANLEDATLKGVARTINIYYRNDDTGDVCRLNYAGQVYAAYASDNVITFGEESVGAGDCKLYAYTDNRTLRTYFVFGNAATETLDGLNRNGEEGAWSAWFSVMTADLAGGGMFGIKSDGFGLQSTAYLYDSYEVVNAAEDAAATIYPNPNGDGDEYYLHFNGSFNGTRCTLDYYGIPVAATLDGDRTLANVLAPVKPSEAVLRIYDTKDTGDRGWEENVFTPFAEPKTEREICELYVEKTDNMIIESTRLNGNCYVFYMRLKYGSYVGDLGDRAWTPRLVVPESALGRKMDLTTEAPDNSSYWMFEYNAKYDFSPVFDRWYTSGNGSRVPTKGSVKVVQNDDKTFNISFYIYDYVAGLQSPGNQKTLVIEVKDRRGLVYKSAGNMLTEEDLQ